MVLIYWIKTLFYDKRKKVQTFLHREIIAASPSGMEFLTIIRESGHHLKEKNK